MLCYRDRTYCKFDDCYNWSKCPYALTDKVREAAVRWWGNDDPPISYFLDKPDCWEG